MEGQAFRGLCRRGGRPSFPQSEGGGGGGAAASDKKTAVKGTRRSWRKQVLGKKNRIKGDFDGREAPACPQVFQKHARDGGGVERGQSPFIDDLGEVALIGESGHSASHPRDSSSPKRYSSVTQGKCFVQGGPVNKESRILL